EANEGLRSAAATTDSASEKATRLLGRIDAVYCQRIGANPQLLARAEDGTLLSYAPSRSSILGYSIFRWLAFSVEVALALAFVAIGQATLVFALVAFMLALGGLLLGSGIGGLLERRWLGTLPAGFGVPRHGGPGGDVVKTVAGAVIVIGLSY